jgi:probable HAF family extracellular repeat protein
VAIIGITTSRSSWSIAYQSLVKASDVHRLRSALKTPDPFEFSLYSSGKMTDLGTLGGTSSYAYGINASGQVVGVAKTGSGSNHAFIYNDGTMTDLGAGQANSINANGQVVGYSGNHAFLYSNGVMTDFNSMIATSSGWTLKSATGINDNRQVVGYGTNPSGQTDAFLLTPMPEPSSLVLFAIGAASLFAHAWRRRRQAT